MSKLVSVTEMDRRRAIYRTSCMTLLLLAQLTATSGLAGDSPTLGDAEEFLKDTLPKGIPMAKAISRSGNFLGYQFGEIESFGAYNCEGNVTYSGGTQSRYDFSELAGVRRYDASVNLMRNNNILSGSQVHKYMVEIMLPGKDEGDRIFGFDDETTQTRVANAFLVMQHFCQTSSKFDSPPSLPPTPNNAPVATEPDLMAPTGQTAYDKAFEILKAGRYTEAITVFQQFLAAYPKSSLASNAQYWIGESYFVTRHFQDGAASFQAVLIRWPDSTKAPDALLKLGDTQYEMKQVAIARSTFASVSARFPGTDAARTAAFRLQQLTDDTRTEH